MHDKIVIADLVTESWGEWAGPVECLFLLSVLCVDKVDFDP